MNGSALFGANATQNATLFAVAAGGAGILIAVGAALRADLILTSLTWGLLVLLAFDLAGGVAANADPDNWEKSASPYWAKLVFAFIHVHPMALTALMAPNHLEWGWRLWLVTVVTVAFARLVARDLRRPFLLTLAAVIIADHSTAAPDGLEWLAPIYVLKLVAAYAWRISLPTAAAAGKPSTG